MTSFRKHLPEFTYHVTVRWGELPISTAEHALDREAAFDAAAEAMRWGCEVIVEAIERNAETGHCIGVSDATAAFCEERGITTDEPCIDCGQQSCICDDEYDRMMEAAE